MKKLTLLFIILLSVIAPLYSLAQDKAKQTDLMRSSGRIYVVIAVMLAILTGIILYLVRLERKIKKLEKENNL
jgi:uncharacterized BrkB/YihY/UPF0761 family membrane protein